MLNDTPPVGSAPLFYADTSDTVILQAVEREQETLLSTCAQLQFCDQVHFIRAMMALFQNAETATDSFQKAIAAAPKGPYADSSARWIRFLADRSFHSASADTPTGALGVMKGLVRAWLVQQTTSNASLTRSSPLSVHALQRRIRDRDRRIAELTDQLSALKRIDLETHRTNKLTPPRTLSR